MKNSHGAVEMPIQETGGTTIILIWNRANATTDHSSRAFSCRTLGSWVRISLEAWQSVCVYSVSVLLCV
jgi:hypothetical protein